MDRDEFNRLLKSYNYDEKAKAELCHYCLANIKLRLTNYKNVSNPDEVAHDILYTFLKYLPKYVFAPFKYVRKVTDNYIAFNYKKVEENLPLNKEIPYEQSFTELEKMDIFKFLEKYLDKRAALIIYRHCIDDISEKDIAKEMNISYANTRAIISRSTSKLKQILKDCNKI